VHLLGALGDRQRRRQRQAALEALADDVDLLVEDPVFDPLQFEQLLEIRFGRNRNRLLGRQVDEPRFHMVFGNPNRRQNCRQSFDQAGETVDVGHATSAIVGNRGVVASLQGDRVGNLGGDWAP